MSNNVPGGTKVLAEHRYIDIDSEDEKKEVRDRIVGEGKQLYDEEDDLKIVKGDKDVRTIELVQIHRPHSQCKPQPRVVQWDKFLPLRSLKVLLVENDDSTRHVVSALLRNCSYQVTPVSNGLEAWKILIDLNNQIDLILTEVVMPGVSGITLLSNIMNHKSCQHIPVIMMSSHDSMGIVLKCLSKGAADFLVKPIRKNELKNLWQHVWRRCHSSSGSESESGIRTEKSAGAKIAERSNNETGSNGDDDDDDDDENDDDTRSIDLLVRDGSDNGSGTQSSWTKRDPEAESPHPMSSWDKPPDSTCAHVIYPRSEAFASSWLPTHVKEDGGQNIQHDDIAMGKDLEIGISMNSDSQINGPSKTMITVTNPEKKQSSQLVPKIYDGNVDKGKLETRYEKTEDERIKQATNKAVDMVCNDEHRRGGMGSKIPTVLLDVSRSKYKVTENTKDLPSLELSLKRMGDVASTSTNVPEKNIFGHSEISAFTRYNTGSTANQGQTGNVGSCSPLDNSSEAVKQFNSRYPPNQTSNSSSNNNDMGSTTNRSFTKPAVAPIKSSVNCSHNSSAFQPIFSQPDGKAPQCGSSNNGRVVHEANAANCSLNGSAGGSNHGSNLHNGSSVAANAELMNMDSDNGAAIKGRIDNASGNGNRVGVYQNRSAQREAALNKFRLKRKDRCFDKKVRYQSRKKLAEQRHRVRGQFVRQVLETEGKDEGS